MLAEAVWFIERHSHPVSHQNDFDYLAGLRAGAGSATFQGDSFLRGLGLYVAAQGFAEQAHRPHRALFAHA